MPKSAEEWQGSIRVATAIFARSLVGGDYNHLERMSNNGRFTEQELRNRVAAVSSPLAPLPDSAFSRLQVSQQPCREHLLFEVRYPIPCTAPDAGALTLVLRLWPDRRDRVLKVQIWDVIHDGN